MLGKRDRFIRLYQEILKSPWAKYMPKVLYPFPTLDFIVFILSLKCHDSKIETNFYIAPKIQHKT